MSKNCRVPKVLDKEGNEICIGSMMRCVLNSDKVLSKGLKFVRQFYRNYDYSRFSPFYHGTSNYHWELIKKSGFLSPRGSERGSVWDYDELYGRKMISLNDRVYFSVCDDYLPENASIRARESVKHIPAYEESVKKGKMTKDTFLKVFGMPSIGFDKKVEKIFLRLDTPEKYINNFVRDEDESMMYFFENSFYNEKNGRVRYLIEKEIVAVIDVIWIFQGFDSVKKIIQAIPDSNKSLYVAHAIAINKPVPVEDLTPLTEKEWYARKCQEKKPYRFNPEEEKVKDVYSRFIGDEKEEKYKRELIDYIKKVKLPMFNKITQNL